MPTYRKHFREDLHLGHEVPLFDTDDIIDKAITGRKIADRVIDWFHIIVKAIRNEHIDDGAVDTRTLANGAVTTPKIADKAVTPEKLSDRIAPEVIDPLLKPLKKKDADLQNQIDSIQIHGLADLQNQIDSIQIHGLAVSNEFGDDTHIGISQKTITDAFNRVWQKLEDITGDILQGFSMVVTPEYFVSEEGCNVHITANTVGTNGVFEKISFYINDALVTEGENVHFLEYDTEITETSVVRCVAKIMGVEYERQHIITHYNSFWLGAGTSYTDVMKVSNIIPIDNGMRGAYDVEVEEGQSIIVIVGDSLRAGFIRADLNGAEIQFTESSVAVDDKLYVVFKSEPWHAGTYNIDING